MLIFGHKRPLFIQLIEACFLVPESSFVSAATALGYRDDCPMERCTCACWAVGKCFDDVRLTSTILATSIKSIHPVPSMPRDRSHPAFMEITWSVSTAVADVSTEYTTAYLNTISHPSAYLHTFIHFLVYPIRRPVCYAAETLCRTQDNGSFLLDNKEWMRTKKNKRGSELKIRSEVCSACRVMRAVIGPNSTA